MRLPSCALAVILLCLTTVAQAAPDAAQGWRPIKSADGIQVWQRSVPGANGFAFRGEAVVAGAMLRVAAIVTDGSRYTEWSKNCIGSFEIERLAPNRVISYRRFTSGAPLVSDRDMVLDAVVSLDANSKSFMLTFHKDHDDRKPPPSGVVRVKAVEGFYQLRAQDADHTYVTYEVIMDPGGNIPAWVANRISRDLPFATLQGLRLQAQKTGYEAAEGRMRAAFDWKSLEGTALSEDSEAPPAPSPASGDHPSPTTPAAP